MAFVNGSKHLVYKRFILLVLIFKNYWICLFAWVNILSTLITSVILIFHFPEITYGYEQEMLGDYLLNTKCQCL